MPICSFKGTCLSNFWPSPLTLNSVPYPTGEHAFQAQKSLELIDRCRIADCPTAFAAKRAGRQLTLRPDWERVKKRAMLDVVAAKFTQNPDLAAQFPSTGDRLLVEGNNWGDEYWGAVGGDGLRLRNPALPLFTGPDGTQYQGRNYLGQILMAVRLVLRED